MQALCLARRFSLRVQGMFALKQLALDITGDSISSIGHYSFHSSGKVVGCYGRAHCPLPSPESNAGAQALPGDAAAHEHQPKRQHRIIGRQRLRQLMFERLQPRTV
jgi:hypothetical protein